MKQPNIAIEQTENFMLLFNQAPAAMAVVSGPSHIYTLANSMYLRLFNKKKKDILGKTIRQVFPEIDGQGIYEIFDTVYKTGEAFTGNEFPAHFDRTGNGKLVEGYFNFIAQPIKDSTGTTKDIMIHAYEVTDQVLARKKVDESEHYFRSLIENNSDAISLRDAKGNLLYVTPSIKNILGYSLKEYKSFYRWQLVHPEDFSLMKASFATVLKSPKKPIKYCVRMKHKDGSWRWMEGIATNFLDEPEMKSIVINFREVTREKEAVDAMKKSQKQLQLITDAVPTLIAYVDNKRRYQFNNKTYEEWFGHTREEVKGKHMRDVLGHKAFKNIEHYVNQALSGKRVSYETMIPYKSGERYVLADYIPHFGENKKVLGFYAIVADITSRKKSEDKVAESERRKDEFLSIASHELKTPVTSIKAYTQVLHSRFTKSGDMRSAEMVTKMDGQLNKLTELINDLLDVTKIEAGKLLFQQQYFDLNELIMEVIEETQRTTSSHTIKSELVRTKTVYGDRDRIGQVLTNLITNAIKYSPRSNEVIVRTSYDRSSVTLSVQDFGVGIPKTKQAKIFDRFYRVVGAKQQTYPGLGLGLFISSEIIRRHHGTIWFESKKGKGSTFHFTLALKPPKVKEPQKKGEIKTQLAHA